MRTETLSRLRQRRLLVLGTLDTLAWVAAVVGYTVLRYEVAPHPASSIPWAATVLVGAMCGVLFLVLGSGLRLHQGRAAVGSHEEMTLLGVVAAGAGAIVTALNLIGIWVPRTAPVAATFIALAMMTWVRAGYRPVRDRWARELSCGTDRTPVLVLGAGEAGHQLVASMLRDRQSAWCPVGLVDDDPLKRYRRICGVPVVGTSDQLAGVAARSGASTVVIAISSASATTVRDLNRKVRAAGLTAKTIPSLVELLDAAGSPKRVGISDIRDIEVTDLLGRRAIETDLAGIAGYLTGRRVLVTGAGGSIGSELCRQIARFDPAELIMLDRDESALHAVQLSMHGRALLDSDETVLADIRDAQTLRTIFAERRPEVVFHAAALKHLPMLERHPGEAIRTNVWGTLNVLNAARAAGTERFVNISTDKAANPANVLGYSKRLAEGLTSDAAERGAKHYLSVRFGNVLGSRGSVLETFAAQVAGGGPVTVTHPRVTRFFMTVQEAVQLVIQAAAIGRGGEVLVLDMGEPVSIDAVARQLIELSGDDIDVVYTGLRDGEKVHEELFGDGERDSRPTHELVSHAAVPPIAATRVGELDPSAPCEQVIGSLARAVDLMSHLLAQENLERSASDGSRTSLSPVQA